MQESDVPQCCHMLCWLQPLALDSPSSHPATAHGSAAPDTCGTEPPAHLRCSPALQAHPQGLLPTLGRDCHGDPDKAAGHRRWLLATNRADWHQRGPLHGGVHLDVRLLQHLLNQPGRPGEPSVPHASSGAGGGSRLRCSLPLGVPSLLLLRLRGPSSRALPPVAMCCCHSRSSCTPISSKTPCKLLACAALPLPPAPALQFYGQLQFERNASYTLYLTADEDAQLWLGGQVAIPWGGSKGVARQFGPFKFAAGWVPFL